MDVKALLRGLGTHEATGSASGNGVRASSRSAMSSASGSSRRRPHLVRHDRVAPAPTPIVSQVASSESTAPRLRDWIGILAMFFGMFLAVMDVQIVASSLSQIQGGLSASADEISWLQTSYLVAEIVTVPLSGMLSRLLSTRVLFVAAALGFVAASALCASATSLSQMILYRAMQGLCGGSLIPLAWPVVYTRFRGPQLATLMVIVSLILNLSSTLGPTIGGFLTDTFSWHWLFLVNIAPGIAVAIIVWLTIDIDSPDFSLLRHFDIVGLALMAVFLGCLEYVLEEGARWDWLADSTIRIAGLVSVTAGSIFFWRVLTYREPIVDIRIFTNRNFALGSFYTFVLGLGMYGATWLIPLFLAQVRGFTALQIGETVVVGGLAQMLMSPLASPLARRIDLRLMMTVGLLLYAFAMYLMANLTNQASFAELLVPLALRGMAMMLCVVPANLITLGTVPPDKLKNASGLYNVMRDLGGAIGLGLLGTIMNDRLHFHWNRLIEDINPAREAVRNFLDLQTSRFDALIAGDAGRAAIKLLANTVQREALVLTYNDVLLLLSGIFVACLLLMPLVTAPRATAMTPDH